MKKVVSYILVFCWLFVIFYLSNQPGNISGSESGSIIYSILKFLYDFFHINTSNLNTLVEIIHNPLRELMHVLEYLVLGLLIINLLKQNNIKEHVILISIMFCFIYATTDEIHQIFIIGRTFEYLDILLDTLGSILGSLFSYKIIYMKNVQK